jgi:hypothetical protein
MLLMLLMAGVLRPRALLSVLLRVLLRILLLVRKTFAIAASASAAAPTASVAAFVALPTLPRMSAVSALLASLRLRRKRNAAALLQHAADDLRGAARGGFVFRIGGIVRGRRTRIWSRHVFYKRLRFVFKFVIAIVGVIGRAGRGLRSALGLLRGGGLLRRGGLIYAIVGGCGDSGEFSGFGIDGVVFSAVACASLASRIFLSSCASSESSGGI